MTDIDESWMWKAVHAAREAKKVNEVPIGAVIVDSDGKILSATSNRTIINNDPTAHAEILALRIAAIRTGNYRLTGTTVYTTLEPCAMCAGALVNARVARLVFGAHDERFGAVETHFRVCDNAALNHRMEITSGVLAEKCRSLLQDFFRERRLAKP
ncbi:MAG: tRNA adenosine(34) deaminase TadA [Pyrinomonadaceae bacterium]